jgi:hypothetical protein
LPYSCNWISSSKRLLCACGVSSLRGLFDPLFFSIQLDNDLGCCFLNMHNINRTVSLAIFSFLIRSLSQVVKKIILFLFWVIYYIYAYILNSWMTSHIIVWYLVICETGEWCNCVDERQINARIHHLLINFFSLIFNILFCTSCHKFDCYYVNERKKKTRKERCTVYIHTVIYHFILERILYAYIYE